MLMILQILSGFPKQAITCLRERIAVWNLSFQPLHLLFSFLAFTCTGNDRFSTMLSRSGENGPVHLVSDLKRKASTISTLSMIGVAG